MLDLSAIPGLASLPESYRNLAVIGVEFLLLIAGYIVTAQLVRLAFNWADRHFPGDTQRARLDKLRRTIRTLLRLTLGVFCLGLVALNGYLLYQDKDILGFCQAWGERIPPGIWTDLGVGILKACALALAAWLGNRLLRRLLAALKEKAKSYEQLHTNDESIEVFFQALSRISSYCLWLAALILISGQLLLPAAVSGYLWILLRIYLIVALGNLVVKMSAAVIESLEALSKKYWYREDYLSWYERLRSLIPLLHRCLEYVIYVLVATLVLLQVEFIAKFAVFGPRVVQAIGVFFLARVIVELIKLLVEKKMGATPDMEEAEQKRRLTLAPIIKSLLQFLVFFVAFVLVLGIFDLNPLPILAGAGIVGVVVGLGAQPLINDIVAGFFILFENLYLVGDYIEAGEARGTVEAIDMRTTKIRDPDGQVHIMRNGQIESVVNYSKGYTHAVVEVGVSYDSDLDQVYRILDETGAKLKETSSNVLAPTEVKGLQAFGESELLIRTITRVKPGFHSNVAFLLRKLIKEAFDREGIEIPFARRVVIFKPEVPPTEIRRPAQG
ncbi:mechanosensitive ion channel family protein [Trichloromonas sp.]|uniref:mechanosensitive ion channel family protein n=1 Tax=Trichloromonas sp. TaxID=3069249 RepID=UPI003D81C06D